mgnify:CR=1 FL=1
MKVLVVVLTGLLIVGCGKDEYDPSMDDQPPGMPANGSLGKNNNPYEEGSISYAIAKGDIEAVKKHLADGADVNVGNPLNVAIESRSTGRKEIVKLLLAKGSDVNAKNKKGETPLVAATIPWETIKPGYDFIGTLLQKKFDLERIEKDRGKVAEILRAAGAK